MPLLKKRPFSLDERPTDLRPEELVWQVRFTKEVFRDYREYLERINLYRQRVWTCKATGKMRLTYEEALVSEHHAGERMQQFPKEFMAPVLHIVQFSSLKLNDLVTLICERLKNCFVEGEELIGRLEDSLCPCKILEVLTRDGGHSYKVGWIDRSGKVISTSVEDPKNLSRKKLPFARGLLKLFIRESSLQNAPWIVHDKLAMEHGIPTEPPEELREKIIRNLKKHEGHTTKEQSELESKNTSEKKRAKMENDNSVSSSLAQAQRSSETAQEEKKPKVVKIKYPIDDLLVKPGADDPKFSERPVPSTKFLIPIDNIGNLLMVWDFCSSFSKLLCLAPFSLDDFENAIAYEGLSNLIVEVHSAILSLLINDHGEYYTLIRKKKRKEMVTAKNWANYLCDFLELEYVTNFADHLLNIKRGRYFMLNVYVKLEILSELVYCALSTDAIRGHLNKCIEQRQVLEAAKREEDLEEMRRRREEKRLKEAESGNNGSLEENGCSESSGLQALDTTHSHGKAKDVVEDANTEITTSIETQHFENRQGSKHGVLMSRKALMKQNLEAKVAAEREKEISWMEERKRMRDVRNAKAKEVREKKLKEQRQENLDRELEKRFIRINALGKDRDHNQYWLFQREGRIFVESADHKLWGFYTSKEELDGLVGSLNPKGERELALQKQLQKHYLKICTALQKRSKEMTQKVILDTAVLRRSVRVSVLPKDSKTPPFLCYINKLRG